MFRGLRTRLGPRMAAVLLAMALIGGGAALAMPGVMADFGMTTAEEHSPLGEVPPPAASAEELVEELEDETELEDESLEEEDGEGDGPPDDVVAFVECVREFAAGQGTEDHVLGGHDCEKPEGLDDDDLEDGDDGPPPEVVAFVACVHEFARGQGDPATRVTGGHDCVPPGELDGEETEDLEELEDDGPPEGVGGPPDWAGPPEGVGGPPEGAGPPGS
ncbi:MAG: hypothetical protein AB1Z57_11840 [Acidimicrobiia bacterium]